MNRSPETTQWFQRQRRIDPKTLDAFGIHTVAGGTAHPYPNAVKIRPDMNDRRRFFDPPLGKGQIDLFGPDQPGRQVYFLVEGETDTMRLWQELEAAGKLDGCGVYGLSGSSTWRPENVARFGDAKTVYVILDNDDPYENPTAAEQGESAWSAIRRDLGKRAVRIHLPRGPKDVCEFFDAYDYEAFKTLCANTPRASWHYEAIDFSRPAPSRDWVLKDIFHNKSHSMVVGEPGMGKSMLTMATAIGLAEGWSHVMGHPLRHHGPVLYVDEENPEDVVRTRMKQMGLTDVGMKNLRYLSNQGIDVLESWENIQDEIIELEPKAVILDSLSEISSAEENSKTEMKETLQRIKQVSRDFDTAVILIHHSDKEKGHARGSGHIRATTDAEWWLGASQRDESLLRLVCKKHRYGVKRGTTHMFRLEDEFEGDDKRIVLRPVGGAGKEPF